MEPRQATCCCGQLRITVRGEPVRISMCHCLDCQRRSGGPFSAQARFPEDATAVEGQWSTWTRTGDSGGQATHCFCPVCGTTVFYRLSALPGMVGVPIGGFADPTFPAPRASVYNERRHSWVVVPEGAVLED